LQNGFLRSALLKGGDAHRALAGIQRLQAQSRWLSWVCGG
jgi:hypothetical protein